MSAQEFILAQQRSYMGAVLFVSGAVSVFGFLWAM